ncbi:Metallo-dependent phosphatase [Hygrophoropsis aurantiaca]|uniref:Metallo-dependent phosphatase n=1 Tax=Hygrophoropsis aurantiaca TaxID=72124 RepID=A0ACB8AAC9_9AGAM|nr:Metallo-dependent phosphatase [Hygrophoropsis aurantiaca]
MIELESELVRVYSGVGHEIPPHPGHEWTRFVCISDTHSRIYSVPAGDVLLHAGDLSSWGQLNQLQPTVEWLKSLGHPVKIMIAGNHDLCLDKEWGVPIFGLDPDIQRARDYVYGQATKDAGLHYLEHEAFQFTSSGEVWSVYGSPAAPVYVQGAFQYRTDEEAQAIYQKIPFHTDILVTHTPPFMTLDRTRRSQHPGCQVLASTLPRLHHCRLHVFGHIHEAHGAQIDVDTATGIYKVSVNAAVASKGNPIVVDLKRPRDHTGQSCM